MKRTLHGLVVALLLAGCSGSSETTSPSGALDAGAPEAAPPSDDDATPPSGDEGASSDASVSSDSPPFDIFDALPIPDGPIGACVECLRDKCAMSINECLNSPTCRAGLLCTVETCLPMAATTGDGGLDPICALGCFAGDFAAALSVQGGIVCVGVNCNDTCGRFLGGD